MYLWWSMYLVFTRMPGESYRRRLRSVLLYLCYAFRALNNSLVCWFISESKSDYGPSGNRKDSTRQLPPLA